MPGRERDRHALRRERVDVQDDGRQSECGGDGDHHGGGDSTSPGEVRREERQDENTGIEQVELRIARERHAEQRRRLERESSADRQPRGEREGSRLPRRARRVVDHQLLPQPVRMLAGVLARDLVEAADALDRDEERLLLAQAGPDQIVDLIAQMSFEFVDIRARHRAPAAQILRPGCDLGVQCRLLLGHRHAPAGLATSRRVESDGGTHTFSSALLTAVH